MMRIIYRSDKYRINTNFMISEFLSKDLSVQEHPFDLRLVEAVQFIRDYANKYFDLKSEVGITITSTYRTALSNVLAGGASRSPHLLGIALDAIFVSGRVRNLEAQRKYNHEISLGTASRLFQGLRKIGISGFGFYDNRFHIDTRDDSNLAVYNNSDAFGRFSTWNVKFIDPEKKK